MSESINDCGGFAFPVPNDAHVNGQEGMSLLDYFAAHALANSAICHEAISAEDRVHHCYRHARLAIQERKRIHEK